MTSPVTRAGLVAVIASFALLAPLLQWGTAALFGVVAILAIAVPSNSNLFDRLAQPRERHTGQLRGIASFSLVCGILALVGIVEPLDWPIGPVIITILIVGIGNFGETASRTRTSSDVIAGMAFFVSGTVGAIGGWWVLTATVDEGIALALGSTVFFASLGALIGALCRTDFYHRDDPVILLIVGIVLWVFARVAVLPDLEFVLAALGITITLGAVAYVLETASVAGMLSGIVVGYVTIVLAGFGWFAVLLAFFAIGGLSTKFRYEEKLDRGVAERRRGARGTGNVLGNSLVAVIAVVGYVMAASVGGITEPIAAFAFAGAVATALADTMSSEIGTLREQPRLITSFERVRAGTDGAITVIGTSAGVVGAAVIAGLSALFLPEIGWPGTIAVLLAGIGGMFADSLFGATIEGKYVDNQGVNFLATAVGALLASGLCSLLT